MALQAQYASCRNQTHNINLVFIKTKTPAFLKAGVFWEVFCLVGRAITPDG